MHRMFKKGWLQTITFHETWCKQTCSSEIASFHLLLITIHLILTDLPASCPFLVLYLLQGWKMPADTNNYQFNGAICYLSKVKPQDNGGLGWQYKFSWGTPQFIEPNAYLHLSAIVQPFVLHFACLLCSFVTLLAHSTPPPPLRLHNTFRGQLFFTKQKVS